MPPDRHPLDRVYELRLFLGGADPADPVVDTAGKVQNALANWLTAIGPLPPLVVLVALLAGGALLVRHRRGRNPKA
ncbi:hypothetical protein ACIRG5_21070 [Lentzea sp. NPDC102401]|uniref:hypothetical protein n=1 Tax=Lentzea sp. NPDC102401 TaxID=3364128 RepID=UPI0037FAF20A